MAMARANKQNSAVKRIMQEAKELAEDDSTDYTAAPLDDDLFEWHATIRGASNTDYEGGLYHLRILLPATYPFSAPDIMLLNPNGRFETNKRICIDGLTSFHEGSWQPAWGVRTAIVGLMSFWHSRGEALQSVGALEYPTAERRRLARISKDWRCETCDATCHELLPPAPSSPPVNAIASSSTATTAGPQGVGEVLSTSDSNDEPFGSQGASKPALTSGPVPHAIATDGMDDTPRPAAEVASPHHPLSSLSRLPPSPAAANNLLPPARILTQPAPSTPLWLDGVIGVLLAVLVVLVARRLI